MPWIAASPAASDRTIVLGSFSKIMAPGLRLGYLRAPAAIRRSCVLAKQAADLHTSTVDQAAAARYLRDSDLDAHIRTICDAYRERRDALLAGLSTALPFGSRWNRPAGGMFVWVALPEDTTPPGSSTSPSGTRWPTSPERRSSPAPRTRPRCACPSPPTPRGDHRGLRRLAKAFA